MMFGDKTIREYLNTEAIKVRAKDILQSAKAVRSSFGTINNEQFMLPMLVLQNIALLDEIKAMRELMEKSLATPSVVNTVVEVKEEVKLKKATKK